MRQILALCALLITATSAVAADDAAPPGRLEGTVVPTHYRVALDVDPRTTDFSGRVSIDVSVSAPTRTIWLHGLGLHVGAVAVAAGGHVLKATYREVEHEFGVARLDVATPVPRGRAQLRFRYTAPFETAPQGLYRTRVGEDWYAFSQLEAIDARRVFPGFDEPGFKTPFDITIATTGDDRVVSNTAQLRRLKRADGRWRHDFATTRPLPTYLLAFAVGPLDIVAAPPIPANNIRREPLPFRVVGTKGQAASFAFALHETPELIGRLEAYFGTPFPYPKIDLIAAPGQLGAMENAGAIISSENIMLFAHSPTPREQSDFGSVMAHELAHQWFGDLVTPAWWDDIWLNESFAEWMGSKIGEQWRPGLGIAKEQLVATQAAMNTDALRVGRPVHQAITRNAQIDTTFDSITYEKGAGVIGMVESYLGEEAFQRGVRLHLQKHVDGTATARDFFAAIAEAGGAPALVGAFRSFIDQPGVPLIEVAANADGSLELVQSRYHHLGANPPPAAELWSIPLCVHVYAGATASKVCAVLTERATHFEMPASAAGAVVYPNADAAGYFRFATDASRLQATLAIARRLPATEAIALADSIAAAFDAGRLGFADFFAAARTLSSHPDPNAALRLGSRLRELHDRLATEEDRALLERAFVELYGERLNTLGYNIFAQHDAGEPAEQQLLRPELVGLLALTARDPDVRAALGASAERSLADPASVDAQLRWRSWAVALQVGGAPLLARLKVLLLDSTDVHVGDDAARALGAAEDPAVADAALDLVLDPALPVSRSLRILFAQVANPRRRSGAWDWLEGHRDALIARVPLASQGDLANLGGSFCALTDRQRFEAVLASRLLRGGANEIEVGRTFERIDDCIALRAATGDAIKSALGRTSSPTAPAT